MVGSRNIQPHLKQLLRLFLPDLEKCCSYFHIVYTEPPLQPVASSHASTFVNTLPTYYYIVF